LWRNFKNITIFTEKIILELSLDVLKLFLPEVLGVYFELTKTTR